MSRSNTATVTTAPLPPLPHSTSSADVIPYVLHLPAQLSRRDTRKRVGWTEDVVDNEQLNKKKSKSRSQTNQPTRPHYHSTTTTTTTTTTHSPTHSLTHSLTHSANGQPSSASFHLFLCLPPLSALLSSPLLSCLLPACCVVSCCYAQSVAYFTSSVASMRAVRTTAAVTTAAATWSTTQIKTQHQPSIAVRGTRRGEQHNSRAAAVEAVVRSARYVACVVSAA